MDLPLLPSASALRKHASWKKLRRYGIFKKLIGFEDYLNNIKDPIKRAKVTKFRLSNHKLMIETGRYQKIPLDRRFCPFCADKVESESHLLLDCPTYRTLRETLIDPVHQRIPNFKHYPVEYKLHYLLNNINTNITNFIVAAMDLRFFLLNQIE